MDNDISIFEIYMKKIEKIFSNLILKHVKEMSPVLFHNLVQNFDISLKIFHINWL